MCLEITFSLFVMKGSVKVIVNDDKKRFFRCFRSSEVFGLRATRLLVMSVCWTPSLRSFRFEKFKTFCSFKLEICSLVFGEKSFNVEEALAT